ncbi:MAG: hypothetical protein ACREXY_24870 [Gammaproteobacteria bacterium]
MQKQPDTHSDEPLVSLSSEDVVQAFDSAREKAADWAARRAPQFPGDNSVTSHMVGKLGEVAVANWLVDQGYEVDRVFLDPAREGECDVAIQRPGPPRRIDVKSWQERGFNHNAGYVWAKQLPYIDKSDLLLWVRTPDLPGDTGQESFDPASLGALVVTLVGWSFTTELHTLGKAVPESSTTDGLEIVRDHWHPMSELLGASLDPTFDPGGGD